MNSPTSVWTQDLWQGVVEAGLHAPSGDNCQPFQFKQLAQGIAIYHCPQRSRHFLNMGHTPTYISLGCVLENIAIYLSAHGLSLDWRLVQSPETQSQTHILAEAKFNSGAQPDSLREHLFRRATDRRPYSGGDLQHPVFANLKNQLTGQDAVTLNISPPQNNALVKACMKADSMIWTHKDAHSDLMHWLRLTGPEVANAVDGMPWRSLGVTSAERMMLRVNRHWGAQAVANLFGATIVSGQVVKKQLQTSAAWLLFSVNEYSAKAVVELGRRAQRCWIQLNAQGFGVQPMSAVSLMSYAHATGSLENLRESSYRDVGEFEPILRKNFALNQQQLPVWLMRTGLSSALPDDMRCPRLPWQQAVID